MCIFVFFWYFLWGPFLSPVFSSWEKKLQNCCSALCDAQNVTSKHTHALLCGARVVVKWCTKSLAVNVNTEIRNDIILGICLHAFARMCCEAFFLGGACLCAIPIGRNLHRMLYKKQRHPFINWHHACNPVCIGVMFYCEWVISGCDWTPPWQAIVWRIVMQLQGFFLISEFDLHKSRKRNVWLQYFPSIWHVKEVTWEYDLWMLVREA